VFVVATATDRVDGDIARAKGLVTDFGAVSDPIADKALMGMALVGLSMIGLLPWWVSAVVVVREVGITALRFVVIRHGVMPASRGGKVKTALQAVAILLYVLPLSGLWHTIAAVVMAVSGRRHGGNRGRLRASGAHAAKHQPSSAGQARASRGGRNSRSGS
jgi:CDP-diacylglycerol--glycerol-3-phosphate 3-phosphatidyltransferase